jgi:iron-sulfur cluster repair protein YtfE (RIC family)
METAMHRNTGRLIGAAGVAALGVVAGLAFSRTKHAALMAGLMMTGDWEKQLKGEHAALKKALKAMADSDILEPVKRTALLTHLDELMTRHTLEEEKVIYPALKTAGAGAGVDALYLEHGEMKTQLRELRELSPEDPAWADRAKALRQQILHHFETEEDLFPLLHQLSDRQRNKALTELVRREAVRVS